MGLARRNRIAKTTAAALALLVQVGGLALLLEGGEPRRPEARAIRIRVMPLTPPRQTPEPKPQAETPPATRTARGTAPPPAPVVPQMAVPNEPPRAITPRIDWQAEMEATARRRVEEEERRAREGQPLDSKPQVMEIPQREAPYERSIILPNGDLQTRTRTPKGEILCTHSRPAMDEMFSPWAKNRPAKCTFRERLDNALTEGLEETVKPRYLRQPPGAGAAEASR